MPFDFTGEAKRLDDIDISQIAYRVKTGEDELHAFMDVEASGSGFDSKGRPKALFEPHLFYRFLGPGEKREAAVKAGLAYESWKPGGYPSDSYPRILKAMEIDEEAALRATSWGLAQMLGDNAKMLGYKSAKVMVAAYLDDEETHLEDMVRYILVTGIDDDLRAHRWDVVARVYNGPAYAKHNYHGRMKTAYQKWTGIKDTPWSPAQPEVVPMNGEELKAIQTQLRALGYVEVGKPDGKWGTKTRAGVLAFRADQGLPLYAGIDDEFKAVLMTAGPREIAPERKEAEVSDLRDEGSRTVTAADAGTAAGAVVAGGAALDLGLKGLEAVLGNMDQITGLIGMVEEVQGGLGAVGPYVLAGVGAYIVKKMFDVKSARLEDHQTGKNAGPA